MMVEDIKKEFNNSLKEIQENTAKELQVLKEKQENTAKELQVLKEKQENTTKQVEVLKEKHPEKLTPPPPPQSDQGTPTRPKS